MECEKWRVVYITLILIYHIVTLFAKKEKNAKPIQMHWQCDYVRQTERCTLHTWHIIANDWLNTLNPFGAELDSHNQTRSRHSNTYDNSWQNYKIQKSCDFHAKNALVACFFFGSFNTSVECKMQTNHISVHRLTSHVVTKSLTTIKVLRKISYQETGFFFYYSSLDGTRQWHIRTYAIVHNLAEDCSSLKFLICKTR